MDLNIENIRWDKLGTELEAELQRQNMAKKELARQLDLSPATVTFLIKGEGYKLRRATVLRACDILKINFAEFEPGLAFCPNFACPMGFLLTHGTTDTFQPFFFSRGRFCPSCGSKLRRGCATCKKAISSSSAFCSECGSPHVSLEQAGTFDFPGEPDQRTVSHLHAHIERWNSILLKF